MLTLRQIEVIRAIMVAGTVNGAAEMLNVSAPGISRVMKHAESVLGIRLFSRRHGRFTPTPEARNIFGQINEVYGVADTQPRVPGKHRAANRENRRVEVHAVKPIEVPEDQVK